jgi:hypothetical protein
MFAGRKKAPCFSAAEIRAAKRENSSGTFNALEGK